MAPKFVNKPPPEDYLIKADNTQLVKAEQLQGKVIVVTFETVYDNYWTANATELIEIYNQIHHKCPFEVIFVAVTDSDDSYMSPAERRRTISPQDRFTEILSCMPWTAVPFSDVTSRKRLETSFGFSADCCVPDSVVIDPTGVLLYSRANSLFDSYGASGYPFSYERLHFLVSEVQALTKQPSITPLLTSDGRNYVISNNGDKVPILDLENKVVALLFFEDGASSSDDLTEKLKMAYNQLVKNENFEVVLIYIHDIGTSEDSYWKTFKTMPWLALPYKDPVCRKLKQVCNYPLDLEGPAPDPGLVIIGPRGEFFEPFAADIIMNFGILAYPFTRRRMVELESEKARKVKPEMLWDSNTILRRKDGSKVRFSQVSGKGIILLFGIDWALDSMSLTILKSKYNEMKDTDNEFEVIQIFDIKMLSYYNERAADVPWLVHPPFDEGSLQLELLHSVFCGASGLLAFDRDGQVVRKTSWFPLFEEGEDTKFPFYAGDLEKEIYRDFYAKFSWMYWGDDSIFKI